MKHILCSLILLAGLSISASAQYSNLAIAGGARGDNGHYAGSLNISGAFDVGQVKKHDVKAVGEVDINWFSLGNGVSGKELRTSGLGRVGVVKDFFVEAGATAFENAVTFDAGPQLGITTARVWAVRPTIGAGYVFTYNTLNQVVVKADYHVTLGPELTGEYYHTFNKSPFGVIVKGRIGHGFGFSGNGTNGQIVGGFFVNLSAIAGS